MTDPEIRSYEKNLREVFWAGDRDLAVRVARLSVLFEDLRLESTAAREMKPIPQVDTSGKPYRYFYFLRRMLVTLDEFAGALHRINANPEWKEIRSHFDRETEQRWDGAVKYFSHNHAKWSELRDEIGGHFTESAARFAVENFRPTATGKIEIVLHWREQTGGIRLLYAEEIVAVNMKRALGPGQHTDDQVAEYMNELFTVVMTAVNEAVGVVHTIGLFYVIDRFRQVP